MYICVFMYSQLNCKSYIVRKFILWKLVTRGTHGNYKRDGKINKQVMVKTQPINKIRVQNSWWLV